MGLFQIEAPMDQAQALAEVLVKSCEQLYGLLQNLRGFKGLDHYWIEIHRLENDGDRIYRDAVASLFSNGIDPMVVIRWRDIFLRLERAIDSTETSASSSRGSSSRTREQRRNPRNRRGHGTRLRLHKRLPRHRERRRDLDLHAAMPPRIAVAYASIFNFAGAFISFGGRGDRRQGRRRRRT